MQTLPEQSSRVLEVHVNKVPLMPDIFVPSKHSYILPSKIRYGTDVEMEVKMSIPARKLAFNTTSF